MSIYGIIAAQVLGVAFAPPPPAVVPAKPAIESNAEPPADERAAFERRLEAVDEAMSKVTDLRAKFEQRKHTPLLKKPLVSKGTVVTKGERVRWDTAEPRESTLLVGDGKVRLFYPADKLVEEYPAGEGFKDLAGGPLPRLAVLKQRFEITPMTPKELGVADAPSRLLALRLTPRTEELRNHVASVQVLIDEATPAAIKVVIVDPEGETTEILFSDVKPNVGVSDADVALKLPDGVRISRPLGEETGKSSRPNPGSEPQGESGREGPR